MTRLRMGEYFMDLMAYSAKGIIDQFKNHYACINVMRRMSVDCDWTGTIFAESTTPDLGILASTDILAIGEYLTHITYECYNILKNIL